MAERATGGRDPRAGPEFEDIGLADLNPRRFVSRHLLDDELDDGPRPARARRTPADPPRAHGGVHPGAQRTARIDRPTPLRPRRHAAVERRLFHDLRGLPECRGGSASKSCTAAGGGQAERAAAEPARAYGQGLARRRAAPPPRASPGRVSTIGSPRSPALAQAHVERDLAEQRNRRRRSRGTDPRRPPARRRNRRPRSARRDGRARPCSPRRRRAAGGSAARWTPARSATSAAASCGVVTTRISALGTSWASEMAMSPVPGGRSMQQDVQVAPEHVGEELLQRAVQHRPAPDHRRIAGRLEHLHRDDLHPVRLRRHDHRLDLGGACRSTPEHPGDRDGRRCRRPGRRPTGPSRPAPRRG